MIVEADEPRVRSWRGATVAACGLTVLLVALAFCSLEPDRLHAKRIDVPPDVLRCTVDTDCVLVDRIGCCPCRSGGAHWAVNKDGQDILRRFLKRACRPATVCVQVNTCRDDLAPACVDGLCAARVADG